MRRFGLASRKAETCLVFMGTQAISDDMDLAAMWKSAALESWVANTALEAALKRDTEGLRNTIQPSDENLISGVHCTPQITHRTPSLRTRLKASISRHRGLPKMESKMIPRRRRSEK